jgi:hypothetical protein
MAKDWELKLEKGRTLTYEQTRDAWAEIILLRAGLKGKEKTAIDAIAKALTKYAPDLATELAKRFYYDPKVELLKPEATKILLGLLKYVKKEWWQ